jgi:hypothetical protein
MILILQKKPSPGKEVAEWLEEQVLEPFIAPAEQTSPGYKMQPAICRVVLRMAA